MKIIFPILVSLILYSCDPVYAVLVQNNSKEIRNIEVYTKNGDPYLKDSVLIQKNSLSYKQPVTMSKNNYSYFFSIGENENAVLQQGIGRPDLSGKVIVNKTDTIVLKTDKRVFIIRRFMFTTVNILINKD